MAREAYSQPLDEAPPKAPVDAILKGTGKARATMGDVTSSSDSAAVVDVEARRRPTRLRERHRLPIAASRKTYACELIPTPKRPHP
jgi:hypothetical protein